MPLLPQVARKFEDYKDRYRNIRLERRDGVLLMMFHTDGDSLVWSALAHEELGYCFNDVSADRGNKAVIMTGTGSAFCAEIDAASFGLETAHDWDVILYDGRRLLMNLLHIEVPVIAAVNGPALFHPEIPVLSDIVLASESGSFQDAPHYVSGIVPGDGAHVVWPHVLGPNRGRYFLLTGQNLDAQTALEYGAVNEVLPQERLLERAWELAEGVAAQPLLTRRYARLVLTQRIKRLMLDELGYGLAVEALAAVDHWPESGTMAT